MLTQSSYNVAILKKLKPGSHSPYIWDFFLLTFTKDCLTRQSIGQICKIVFEKYALIHILSPVNQFLILLKEIHDKYRDSLAGSFKKLWLARLSIGLTACSLLQFARRQRKSVSKSKNTENY